MTPTWLQRPEAPIFVFDKQWLLQLWNEPAQSWTSDRTQLEVGMAAAELAPLGISGLFEHPDLLVMKGEAVNISLPDLAVTGMFLPISTRLQRDFCVLVIVPRIVDLEQEPEVIEHVFDWLMQRGELMAGEPDPKSTRNQQLIQSGKMAAIGQLAAGVAHEINNPIGYINSNLNALSHYVSQLVGLTNMVERATSLDEVKAQLIAIDYHFLHDDIQDCIRESAEGANRVRDIVAALKDFSHADDGRMEYFDLTDVFQSTLKFVSNEVKYKCEVHEVYQSASQVYCNGNQIKQVAMNLIVNAAQAIEQQGHIWIRTGEDDSGVWFSIEDTGNGIPYDVQKHIFEPFYTTKPIGQGTGLGLSLSFNIMNRHGGSLTFESKQDQGTVFTGWLPLTREEAESGKTDRHASNSKSDDFSA